MEKIGENFSVADGILVQSKQLAKWKKVLKRSVYSKLHEFATRGNTKAKDGFSITRGVDLDNFLKNYEYYLNVEKKQLG